MTSILFWVDFMYLILSATNNIRILIYIPNDDTLFIYRRYSAHVGFRSNIHIDFRNSIYIEKSP